MILLKCTQINTRTSGVMLFCIASGNGVIRYGVRKDLCTSEWRLLLCKNMNLLDTISITNGMPASAGELILFFGVIALMIFDEIISNKK